MRPITVILTLLTIAVSHPANADDAAKQSEEMKVLGRFIGTWDMDLTINPTGSDVMKTKKTEIRTWSLGGAFVRFEDAKNDKSDGPEFHLLVTYDPTTKTYPGFMMFGTGRTLVTGTWDASTSTMTFEGKSPDDGNTFVFKNRFIDGDHAESTGVMKNAQGEVFVKQSYKQTRRKK